MHACSLPTITPPPVHPLLGTCGLPGYTILMRQTLGPGHEDSPATALFFGWGALRSARKRSVLLLSLPVAVNMPSNQHMPKGTMSARCGCEHAPMCV